MRPYLSVSVDRWLGVREKYCFDWKFKIVYDEANRLYVTRTTKGAFSWPEFGRAKFAQC